MLDEVKRAVCLVMLAVGLLSTHCGGEGEPAARPKPAPAPTTPPKALAGFLDVAPREVVSKGKVTRIDATARLFYNYRPADEAPEVKPIFVVFNGFSAEVVRAFGTGPTTVAEGGEVVPNPASLTKVANLLYLEPRQAGFSYDVMEGRSLVPSDCGSDIFNEYVDAADTLLATLTFLAAHPELRGPLYWLGESYAGVRVQWILAYLRGRWDLASYVDTTLDAAIAKSSRSASLRAGQLLLQPWLVGKSHATAIDRACRDPEVLAELASSLGVACVGDDACSCALAKGRSSYNYTYTDARQKARELEASMAHVIPSRAEALFGLPLSAIPRLGPESRGRGFKCSPPDKDVPSQSELVSALGVLPNGQSYYAPYSPLLPGKEVGNGAFDWRERDDVGRAFVDNLRDVPTFVTNGNRDLVVPMRALVPALRALAGEDRSSLADPSRVRVVTESGERFVDIGSYPDAGHMVTMISPEAFSRDVAAWLSNR